MNNTVLRDYDIEKISFKKPEKITNKVHIFDVKYNKNQHFIIQTPKLLIPNVPMIYSYNSIKFYKLKLVAYNYNFEKKTKKFIKEIENIDKIINKKASIFWSNIGENNKNKVFINSSNHYNNKVYLYFNIQFYNNKPIINIYDWNKNQKNIKYLMEKSLANSLIWFKNIWIKNNKIGLNWIILQMKVFPPIYKINECLIIEDDEQVLEEEKSLKIENNNSYKNHEIYSKYFKMKRLRVPIQCIQHKMKSENIDPLIILKDENSIVSEKQVSKTIVSNHLNNLINVKLKNVKVNENETKKTFKNISSNNKNRAPTLFEILNMKNSLKKIK